MNSHDKIFAKYATNIRALSARFSGHPGMSEAYLASWLRQFNSIHIPLIIELLESSDYFTRSNIQSFCDTLVSSVYKSLPSVSRHRILFVIVGNIWDGDAAVLARYLKYSSGLQQNQVVQYTDLNKMKKGQWGAIVFIKDFAGTGTQLMTWWQVLEPLVLPLEARVILAPLILNHIAEQKLRLLPVDIITVVPLGEEKNIFHQTASRLSPADKGILLAYCQRANPSPDFVRGFGHCGLLVGFDYGCPNDSIPIFWSRNTQWSPIFSRRA